MRKRIVAGVLALLVTFSSISFPQKVQAETATEENAATETGDSEGIEETGTENAGETESTGEPDYGETESTGELDTEGTETVIEETGTETEAEEPETEPMTEEAETEELETAVEDLEAETETEEAAEEPETEIGEITEPTEETEEEDFIAEMPNAIMLMSANTGDVTRAEWLSNLVSTFEMYVEDDIYPDNYFSDLDSSSDYYYDVLVAVDFGVVEIEAGGEIRPDDAATREFAAYTLNYCLGFYNEDASYSFSDTSACSYPQDDQIAIDRGWFTLVDGAFEPEQPITTAEMNAMLSDAATIYASTAINENYDSSYVFADYVVEVPYGTEVSIDENDIVTITGLTGNISVGDTFVVYPTELPCLYMAASVETNGENTVITTSEADEASAIVSIDAEGTAAIDLSQFEEAEGVTAQYVTSEAQAQMLSAARGISVTRDSVLASKEITLSNGVKATITCNLTDLALNHNIDSANNSYYVSVSGTSTISGTVSIDAVAASGASSSITLGSVRVAGIGKVTISADLTLAGKIVATYTGGFEAGVQYSSSNGFRLVKSFTKKSFTTAAEADAKIGLKADFGVNMLLAKASIYATTGIQAKFISNSYNDGNTPNNCTNISAWLYARVGASATFGVGSLSKSFRKDLDIFTAGNSPIYISYHYEDGKQVYSCARGSKNSQGGNYFYYTGANSYYGYSSYGGGSSKGVDSNGNEYVIYTYEVDGRNATITGYKGNASVMVIPETLDGYTVTAIGGSAFKNNTRLAAVVIPDSVTSIGGWAFYGCTSLQNVTLSKNLLELGSSAFGNCVGITAIEIPKSIDMSNVGW
ncbi:MAG: leucine-rich repeat protein, partial [Roseburia sp.]